MNINELIQFYTDEDEGTRYNMVRSSICPRLNTVEMYDYYDNLGIIITIDWSQWHKSFFFDIYENGIKHNYRGIPNMFYTRRDAEDKAFVLAELFHRGAFVLLSWKCFCLVVLFVGLQVFPE